MAITLQATDNYHWDLTGIEFALNERVGKPEYFIGRIEEMEYLYAWAHSIRNQSSRSLAFLGRRKIGKSLMIERLFNIIYSEHDLLIPFFYEFKEGKTTAREFAEDFITRFYMQVIGYYTRDINWIRDSMEKNIRYNLEILIKKIAQLTFPHQDICLIKITGNAHKLATPHIPYEYIQHALSVPDAFASTVGVAENVMQIMDELQYLNMEIDAGEEKILSKAYMSTAESKVAPLLVTGSLMGVLSEQLMRYTPQRFYEIDVPKMKEEEAIAMTLNYGEIYHQPLTPEVAKYLVYITNRVPGRIQSLLQPALGKPKIKINTDVDQALSYEVSHGVIRKDWYEYLALAMHNYNSLHMKRIVYFLCKNEGTFYYPEDIKKEMNLDINDEQLLEELYLLHKYDIIEMNGGCYGGVFDRTLKKVLMANFGNILNLPIKEFKFYFNVDNHLDYVMEKIKELELSLEESWAWKDKLQVLRGAHNNLKGHPYEQEVLLRLLSDSINQQGELTKDIDRNTLNFQLNYHLPNGQELDLILWDSKILIAAECKHYEGKQITKINEELITEFMEKIVLLRLDFPVQTIRPAFFSYEGFMPKIEELLTRKQIYFGK